MKRMQYLMAVVITIAFLYGCSKDATVPPVTGEPFRTRKTITYNGVEVALVIDKPASDDVHALVVYHGTVLYDSLIVDAAYKTLDGFRNLLEKTSDVMVVSVAYPEEGLLIGDNLLHAEAALLWVTEQAESALGIRIGKVFLAGHSQGGYLVTRLNTMHATDGVIANAPGPIDLVFRCGLEERGQIPNGINCTLLRDAYGTTLQNPNAYRQRSLLQFADGHLSDILFVQGMEDSPIQMRGWSLFRQALDSCANCSPIEFTEVPGMGHQALFTSEDAKSIFNDFIRSRTD